MPPTSDHDPDTDLIATRQASQLWLMERPDACGEPDDLTSLDLRIWAAAFLRTTSVEASESEERLREQGESSSARRGLGTEPGSGGH